MCKHFFTVLRLNILWYTSRNQDESLSSTAVCKMTTSLEVITVI